MTKRFGLLDGTRRARLNAATTDQLERWVDRILEAQTLDDAFTDQ